MNNNYNNYIFDYNEKIEKDIEKKNLNKKLKYAKLDDIDRNNPELILKKKSEFIQHENLLKLSKDKKVKKTETILRSEIRPDDYNIPIENNNLEDNTKIPNIRIDGVDVGAGRGFGNLNISNNIRNGENSRSQNNKFKKIKEAEIIDRFEILDKDYQNPINLILPFPRGGDITRKKAIIKKELDNKKFNFKY